MLPLKSRNALFNCIKGHLRIKKNLRTCFFKNNTFLYWSSLFFLASDTKNPNFTLKITLWYQKSTIIFQINYSRKQIYLSPTALYRKNIFNCMSLFNHSIAFFYTHFLDIFSLTALTNIAFVAPSVSIPTIKA